MKDWLLGVAVGLLLIAPLTASAPVPPPRVVDAVKGTDGRSVTRFTLRFSEPMVSLGSQSPPPFEMNCPVPGQGRWVDPAAFVWEFEKPLPGSTTCRADLKRGLKALAGRLIQGRRSFTIDSGGPFAVAILAGDEDQENIEEDQGFLIASNGPVDRASVASGAYCAVDGIGERIAVDLLSPATVDLVLRNMEDGQREDFLRSAGVDSELPSAAAARQAALGSITGLKCRRALPPGRDIAVVWGASIRSPNGRTLKSNLRSSPAVRPFGDRIEAPHTTAMSRPGGKIGRASCRERV